jgi:hypothetical protein
MVPSSRYSPQGVLVLDLESGPAPVCRSRRPYGVMPHGLYTARMVVTSTPAVRRRNEAQGTDSGYVART